MTLIPFPADYRPTDGRRRLFMTVNAEIYEQDEHGQIWREGELLSPRPLRSFGTPRLARLRELIRGERAALLFDRPGAPGAVHFTGVLRVMWCEPTVGLETDPSWIEVARYDLVVPRPDPA